MKYTVKIMFAVDSDEEANSVATDIEQAILLADKPDVLLLVSPVTPAFTVVGGGVGRCTECGSTDWVANLNRQGCFHCRDRREQAGR